MEITLYVKIDIFKQQNNRIIITIVVISQLLICNVVTGQYNLYKYISIYYNQQYAIMHKKHHKKVQRFLDVPQLEQRIKNETPKSGQYFYDYKLQQARKEEQLLNSEEFHRKFKINFSDLPISQPCIKGLTNRKFTKMTEIQRCVIPHALADRDIMAASRTGSGKTLCYLIPLIQKLHRHKFIPIDGLGAIVIVPVRQLAMQVFQVLNSFTSNIQINVGLIIGGKNVQYEKERISSMNVLICTPGRLLQHLQETYGFQTSNLQMLILDEADVMMEMGFQNTLKSIIQYLPKCQTLLFSATLNNQIKLLANISMNQPEKIFLHSRQSVPNKDSKIQNIYETPAKLTQYFMLVEAEQKINTLYSFLKAHQRQKIIVFVSTCKQVRFIYEAFKKFRLGLPMFELQGHQKQKKRMAIYFTFCQKKYGLLISTNIASRGLDFPMIDWVIQYDIPQNTETYVHRIGRTARFKYEGKALTFVRQSELPFIDQLKQKNINIHKIKQNPQKFLSIESSLQSICSQHQDIKYLAQRSLISYLKFVHKAPNKNIFNIKNIDTAKLAESFGLQNVPVVSIKTIKKQQSDSENQQNQDNDQNEPKLTKIQKLRLNAKLKKNQIKEKKNKEIQSKRIKQQHEYQKQQSYDLKNRKTQLSKQKIKKQQQKTSKIGSKHIKFDEQSQQQNDEDLLRVKNKHVPNASQKPILTVTKNRMKKIRNEGIFDGKNKIHFDDDMNPITDEEYLRRQYLVANEANMSIQRDFSNKIYENKAMDEQTEKRRRRQKRMKTKQQKMLAKGQIMAEKSKHRQVELAASLDEAQQQVGAQEDDE